MEVPLNLLVGVWDLDKKGWNQGQDLGQDPGQGGLERLTCEPCN